MKPQPTYIYGAAANVWPVFESPPDLRPLLQTLWNKRFRRINHFIELTLIGAKSCLDRSRLPIQDECDIYLASEQGNVSDVVKTTESLFRHMGAPMPLTFLNVTNNMAGFHLAQHLGLHSQNLTVAHQAFPFETALDLATFNITTSRKTNPCALIGGVEECAYPLTQHRQRMNQAADTPLAEGSSWLHIGGGNTQKAIACCEWVKFFSDDSTLLSFLKRKEISSSAHLAGGYGMERSQLKDFASALAINNRYDCRDSAPFHNTHCAFTIASFILEHRGDYLIHINRDKQGRYAVVCISMIKDR